MSQKELTVTGITKIPDSYNGEPCVFIIEITDIKGGIYESEIHLDGGFHPVTFRDAIYNSFKMCDAMPESVNVKAFRIKKNNASH